jgi:hypothetical protein
MNFEALNFETLYATSLRYRTDLKDQWLESLGPSPWDAYFPFNPDYERYLLIWMDVCLLHHLKDRGVYEF